MSERCERIVLKFPPRTHYLCPIRQFLENLARGHGFSEGDVQNIVMAADEALSNSICYSRDTEEPLVVTIELCERSLAITVEDAGDDFREQFGRPIELDRHLNEMRGNGLGLHIMRTFMDSVDYRRSPQQRNYLTLIKYLP